MKPYDTQPEARVRSQLLKEPYEARVSRTVVRGARGEIPLVYSSSHVRFGAGKGCKTLPIATSRPDESSGKTYYEGVDVLVMICCLNSFIILLGIG